MLLKNVQYENYRNIESASLAFSPGVNILWGNNAQGKTNALEGIYCFASGKSFRGVRDRELLRIGADTGGMTLTYADADRDHKLQMQFYREKTRRLKKNGVGIRRTADFLGNLHGVLFCPEHLSMIKGAPALRRGFLDAAISQLKPAYLAALSDYAKLLKQRNALLKDDGGEISAKMPLLEVLTVQMATCNTRIVVTRDKYVKLLQETASDFVSDMTGGREALTLTYVSDAEPGKYASTADMTEGFYRKCMEYARREFAAENTLHGCHRDDIQITLDGKEARVYASQGQDRSIALAMKLGEGELSKAATGEYPIFLFDDVLSELDDGRQSYLMERLGGRQVILTSCNEALFRGTEANLIHVEDGVFDM